jgi:hypothetical protein
MNNWQDMTIEERVKAITIARQNPCGDGNHTYEDRVVSMGKATMLNQVCIVCFDTQGWVYNWQKEDSATE